VRGIEIGIGYVHPGMEHEIFAVSLRRFAQAFPQTAFIGVESGPLIARHRNRILDAFVKEEGLTHLLMCDTDIGFMPEQVVQLMTDRKPIVSGLYHLLDADGTLRAAGCKVVDGVYLPLEARDLKRETFQVDAVGMGFCLIERRVITELLERDHLAGLGEHPHLWPFAEILYNGQAIGEDVTFCLRSEYRSWLNPNVRVQHTKRVIL
jgi:hypothetical protein